MHGRNHHLQSNMILMIVTSDNGLRRVKVLPSSKVFVGFAKVYSAGLFYSEDAILQSKKIMLREANIEV